MDIDTTHWGGGIVTPTTTPTPAKNYFSAVKLLFLYVEFAEYPK